jgi:hypothetical protein
MGEPTLHQENVTSCAIDNARLSCFPAPRWSGVKYICCGCGALRQLEAADICEPSLITSRSYFSPPCPTPGCGVSDIFQVPAPSPAQVVALLAVGLEQDEEEELLTPNAQRLTLNDEEGDWNAS